jgi:hypothetical protein
MSYDKLCADWIRAKQAEKDAVDARRYIEDQLRSLLNVDDAFEGTANNEIDGYKIKVVGRMTRKVDSEKLQELAAENGITEHLSSLFRWKAEIASKAWESADESITAPLMEAITTTPSRPTFTITKE